MLQAEDGSIGVLRSAGSDVGKAPDHVIEQQAMDRVGQPDDFRTVLFEWQTSLASVGMCCSYVANSS